MPNTKSKKLVHEPVVNPELPSGHDHCYSYKCNCSPQCNCKCDGSALKDATIKDLSRYEEPTETSSEEVPILSMKSDSVCDQYLKSDEKVSIYTGLPSLSAFEDLVNFNGFNAWFYP